MKAILRLLSIAVLATAASCVHAQAKIRVPSEATLQQAIASIGDGGIIEIATGIYTAPTGGFTIFNAGRRFTIRAASGASVVLAGSGSNILHFSNPNHLSGKPVTFERLTFSGGVSSTTSIGGAVTLVEADASFIGCTFLNNSSPSANGGGGAILSQASTLFIVDSVFSGNNAHRFGGALGISGGSRAAIHGSRFVNNRVNLPNHFPDSLGGAIFLLNSDLRFTNSRFENNQAGLAGGAIYAYGSWTDPVTTPRTDAIGSNSTFVNNRAQRDATSALPAPMSGGAVQAEDQVRIRLFNSRFIANASTQGGAVATYRSLIEIHDGTFIDNVSTGTTGGEGYGAAALIVSEDQTVDTINRPNGKLLIRDSYFQGRSSGSVANGRYGGCVAAVGDTVRAFGLDANIPAMGTLADNRAVLDIVGSSFVNCIVAESSGGGFGGAIMGQLIDLSVSNSAFLQCEAQRGGSNTGSGGAIAIFDASTANIVSTTFARSSAGFTGGAIWSQGSNLDVDGSNFIENQLSAGAWGGAAIYSAPQDFGPPRQPMDAAGLVQNSVITDSQGGSAILEYDSTSAPVNRMRYGGNRVFPNDSTFFANVLVVSPQTPSQLSSVILHGAAKAPTPNIGQSAVPVAGSVVVAPSVLLATSAQGDPPPPTASYVAFGYSGSSGTLNGVPVAAVGVASPAAAGTHVLSVDGTQFTDTLVNAPTPATVLNASPADVATGGSTSLNWSTVAGTFLEQIINEGIAPAFAASGNTVLTGVSGSRTYRGLLVAREGGAIGTAHLDVADTLIFKDDFETP